MTRTLDYPLYANKPQRRLPASDVIVVTMYRSTDRGNTVREFDLFTTDDAYLGRAHYQPANRVRRAGYSLVQVPRSSDEQWPTLAAFAAEMKRRHGIEEK